MEPKSKEVSRFLCWEEDRRKFEDFKMTTEEIV